MPSTNTTRAGRSLALGARRDSKGPSSRRSAPLLPTGASTGSRLTSKVWHRTSIWFGPREPIRASTNWRRLLLLPLNQDENERLKAILRYLHVDQFTAGRRAVRVFLSAFYFDEHGEVVGYGRHQHSGGNKRSRTSNPARVVRTHGGKEVSRKQQSS